MRQLYLLLALVLMSLGGYSLFKGKDAGAVLIGAGVSMTAIQQVEEHKQREQFDVRRQNLNRIDELREQVDELKAENSILKEIIEEKDAEISELKIEKAVLETRLEYTDDPYYMRAKLDNPALPESSLEEFDNPQYQADEAEYNEIEVDSEDSENV